MRSKELNVSLLLANTYHLYLRPGHELIRRMGGLHQFMSWRRAILTDSGGFQVFSLAELRKVSDEGVRFRSHLDGSEHMLTPEKAIEIQRALGSDIAMVLDECIEYPATHERAAAATRRTIEWARRSQKEIEATAPSEANPGAGLSLPSCRAECTRIFGARTPRNWSRLISLATRSAAWPWASRTRSRARLPATTAVCLPPEKPRYVMGVGKPEQLADYVRCGVDMMDCVLPTRNARNGYLYTQRGPTAHQERRIHRTIHARSTKAAPAWFAAAIRAPTSAIFSGQMKFWAPS